MKPSSSFLFAVAAVAVLAGAVVFAASQRVDAPSGPPPGYRAPPPHTPVFSNWGLGLSTDAGPRPPYVDDPQDLEWLAGRVNALQAELGQRCHGTPNEWSGSDLRGATRSVLETCTDAAIAATTEYANTLSPPEAEAYAKRLRDDNLRAFDNATAALSRAPYGSEVEAQVLGQMMAELQLYRRFIERFEESLQAAKGQGYSATGDAALMAWTAVGLSNIEYVARNMGWSGVRCTVDLDELAEMAEARLARAKALAEPLANQTERDATNSNYGGLYLLAGPNIEFHKAHGFGPGLLFEITRLDLKVAYWEGFIAESLPTRQEGQALLHQYYKTHRHLVNEFHLGGLEYSLRDFGGREFDRHPERWLPESALEAKVLDRMGYHFDRIQCP